MKKCTLLFISCLLATINYAQTTDSTEYNGFQVELEYEYTPIKEQLKKEDTKQGYDTITFADILFNFDTDYNLPCDTFAKWLSIDATLGEGAPLLYDCSWWYLFRNGEKEPFLKTQLLFSLRLKEWRRTHPIDEYRIKHKARRKLSKN